MLGNEEDKKQEPAEEQIIGLDLNVDQATITYLSYTKSIEDTELTIKELKHLRTIPVEQRPKELQDPEELNGNMQLAKYTLTHLRYLQGEVKTIMIELAPAEEDKPKIITKPNWDKKD